MRLLLNVLVALALLSAPACADPWKDKKGHGHWGGEYGDEYPDRGRPYAYEPGRKEEFWDGNCRIERKWKGNGEYKEKRKCKDRWD
jgi:hypothetical protein